MPYWKHLKGFFNCIERLSYLLSQGVHRCDVAIIYPVASMEARIDGEEAVQCAFAAAETVYQQSIDFDFIDFQSIERAEVRDQSLHVAGEVYKVLVIPSMRAIRHSSLVKALEFHKKGGKVIALGALPEASDQIGFGDPEVESIVRSLFPRGAAKDLLSEIHQAIPVLDYQGKGSVLHRKIGEQEIYVVYGAPSEEVTFRATGKVEQWDPWTGEIHELAVNEQNNQITKLRLPLSEKEIQVIVFSPGTPRKVEGAPAKLFSELAVEGEWEFELIPTCDNRYGDFHFPATPGFIGPEIRKIQYQESEAPGEIWKVTSLEYGPKFIKYREHPGLNPKAAEGIAVHFSGRWGIENNPGLQGYHGLKAKLHEEVISIGSMLSAYESSASNPDESHPYYWTTVESSERQTAYLLTGAIKPLQCWVNGVEVFEEKIQLESGVNQIVLFYDKNNPGRTYFFVSKKERSALAKSSGRPLEMIWYQHPDLFNFDIKPSAAKRIGWYRFVSPPGFEKMKIAIHGKAEAWADGVPMISGGDGEWSVSKINPRPVSVLLKIEQAPGFYAGEAFKGPIELSTQKGVMKSGDWSLNEGLAFYSGGASYRQTVKLPRVREAWIDLENVVSSVEVLINGKSVGIKAAPPWRFEISSAVQEGENEIKLLIFNTLGSHYKSIPTKYTSDPGSGLLGTVKLIYDPSQA